ncbi:MAG: hypothetical protein HQK77_14260 [Desulfobacterales bacterium]|nr:hypothetical protein [Desulfobacterales bacterium]
MSVTTYKLERSNENPNVFYVWLPDNKTMTGLVDEKLAAVIDDLEGRNVLCQCEAPYISTKDYCTKCGKNIR